MKFNRGFLFAPRLAEPAAMALIGAGFFIFVSALFGGDFWSGIEERLWREARHAPRATLEAGPKVFNLDALAINGSDPDIRNYTEAQRRLSLAHDLDLLSAAGAKVVVLEAWLDDASQTESQLLLDSLLASQKKTSIKIRQSISSLKDTLNADRTLAESISKAANVLLPVMLEPVSGASLGQSEWPWRGAYQVSLYGKGAQNLESSWRPSRAPLGIFEQAGAGMAALSAHGFDAEKSEEVPGVFQVGKSWVNSVALQAASLQLDIPPQGLHFLWDEGRLNALELKSVRYPFNSRGSFWLAVKGDRVHLQDVSVVSLSLAPQLLSGVKGKVVFYRPWPGLLSSGEAFQSQRDLFAALASRSVRMGPVNQHELAVACLIFFASFFFLAVVRSRWAWLVPLSLVLYFVERSFSGQRPLAPAMGCLLGACLAGFGLRLLKSQRLIIAGQNLLKGFVDPCALPFWEPLVDGTAKGPIVISGAYVALDSSEVLEAGLWEAWAKRNGAFVDPDAPCQWGFVLCVSDNATAALIAAKELQSLLPKSKISFGLSHLQMSPYNLLSAIRWRVEGDAKTESVQMVEQATDGEMLVNETDYSRLRDKVKVQLKGEFKTKKASRTSKILNVLAVN